MKSYNIYIIKMDYKEMMSQIMTEKPLPERQVKSICKKIQQILTEQSNLLRLSAPICVVGDVHGQFFDVLKLFSLGGQVPITKYVFIGDYVDRGFNSLQTILYLFILKILYPDRIYFTRGNHQSRQISSMYGFQDEVNKKYGHTGVWKMCNETFDYLPLAAVIEDQIFCVHGGLSPDIHALDQIRQIQRVMEIPTEGPFADLMWSDPEEIQTWIQGPRGAGWLFGHRVVTEFNHHNNLKLIARAHQLAQEGYCEWFAKKNLVTVWSAPNYCYRCKNLASFMKVDQAANHSFVTYEEDTRSRNSKDFKLLIPYFL